MKEIVVYDSGIGGVALLNKLRQICPKENYVYFADNARMPYGNIETEELVKRVCENIEGEIKTKTKCVVIACNTITSQAIEKIRLEFPKTKFFGIEPEIKSVLSPAIASALLLATPQTCKSVEGKISGSGIDKIVIHPAKALARVIESEIANKEAIYREIIKIKKCYKTHFQGVVLGCTHYALVKDVFLYAFGGDTKLFDGIWGTANHVAASIAKEIDGFGSLRLVLTKDDMFEKLKYASIIN